MPLSRLLLLNPTASGIVCDFLTDSEIFRSALAGTQLHRALGWIAEYHDPAVESLVTLPVEITERLQLYLPFSARLQLSLVSLTAWKLFNPEFSIASQSSLSKYLNDPIVQFRT